MEMLWGSDCGHPVGPLYATVIGAECWAGWVLEKLLEGALELELGKLSCDLTPLLPE